MIVTVPYHLLEHRDISDVERVFDMIGRSYRHDPHVSVAVVQLHAALDGYRRHVRPYMPVRLSAQVPITHGQSREVDEHVRAHLVAALQLARDKDWLSDSIRLFLNELLIELVDDGRRTEAETDAIRQLYVAPASRNPKEAA